MDGSKRTLACLALAQLTSELSANPLPAPQGNKPEDITGSKADSSIGSSADVWAMLVANIVPLLILLGEKHVKAYFKTMRHFSHYLIYAVGPIGLVTAVVTLIRILPDNFRAVKRLIGRQYERRAEVLSDVTSVSCGPVETEFKDGAFEQTTQVGGDDVAICYLQGKVEGSVEATFKAIEKYWDESFDIYNRFISRVSPEISPTVDGQFILSYLFRSSKVETARQLALHAFKAPCHKIIPPLSGGYGYNTSNLQIWELIKEKEAFGLVTTFSAITGVSMGLTTVNSKDTLPRISARLVLSAVIIIADIVLIYQNWLVQRDLQNTALISVGLLVSTAGAFFTAHVVDSLSVEKSFRISDTVKAGFYSQSSTHSDWGRQLKEIPEQFIISCDAQGTQRAKQQLPAPDRSGHGSSAQMGVNRGFRHWRTQPSGQKSLLFDLCTVLVALLMSVGYVALYVGLRTAEFWITISIFASSALACLARAFLVPDTLPLEEVDISRRLLTPAFPFSYRAGAELDIARTSGAVETFFWDREESSSSFQDGLLNLKFAKPVQSTKRPPFRYEVIGAQKGCPIGLDVNPFGFVSNPALYNHNASLHSALRLVIALRRQFLAPVELVHFSKSSEVGKFLRTGFDKFGTPLVLGLVCPAFSDIIENRQNPLPLRKASPICLVRQPLEILINTSPEHRLHWGFASRELLARRDSSVTELSQDAWGTTMWDFIINYKSWLYRANAAYLFQERRAQSIRLFGLHRHVSTVKAFTRHRKDRPTSTPCALNGFWMAVKIAYLCFRSWPVEKLQEYYDGIPVPNDVRHPSEEHIQKMVQLMKKSKTYIDIKNVLDSKEGESHDKAMDYTISARRWLHGGEPKPEPERLHCPFDDIQLDLREKMFEKDGIQVVPSTTPAAPITHLSLSETNSRRGSDATA
ncbi:hypothetical protein BJ508DRAFT_417730 [Ascobolus immersus RN42]|uniref:Uncharacterized protein n=1 Tax=Ascobolus immersus RN42 TaxID=1160509 RepID=A0A3N4I2J1_ASCIM|nr:hypothetical protein BJ508DRAFT_417730 [Ascobolus immersus RN42]